MDRIRRQIVVRGIVQGVGFRPFVYRIASELGLAGFVINRSDAVRIEVEGTAEGVAEFERKLRGEAPPLAVILEISAAPIPAQSEAGFRIAASETEAGASTPIPPDIATCDDCLREMFDPHDRRYLYPFLNCTNCGPRFTIIRAVPYDRPATTMVDFPMCEECAHEYHDPANRRFHAQPTACPRCGPRVWFRATSAPRSEVALGAKAIDACRAALAGGEVIAIKGIGGFHLACDAGNASAVRLLRERKGRHDKPLAIMVPNVTAARRWTNISTTEEAVLSSPRRPIVLLRKNDSGDGPAEEVAPGQAHLGLMLPYAPLHHLLIGDRPLVMTSGNLSEEPIARDNKEAIERLSRLADGFLMHDRGIHAVCDDSVVRVFRGAELPIRRARGYTPFPVVLDTEPRPILAVGGELKATLCVTKGSNAYLSQHIGDMANLETMQAFECALQHLGSLFRTAPTTVACDLHPGYLSTQWAHRYAQAKKTSLVPVQHHHAHIASVMAEHGLTNDDRVIGVAWDGTGYGTDGTIWGGEFLVAGYGDFERVGYLRPIPLPGGDAAIKRPYRSALAHLFAAGVEWSPDLPCVTACPPEELRILRHQIERDLNCVPCTSMGRLFDALASLTGICQNASYEAQPAMELEARAGSSSSSGYDSAVDGDFPLILDPKRLLESVIADLRAGREHEAIAGKIHTTVAGWLTNACCRIRDRRGLDSVALSGGTFQNVLLLEQAVARLEKEGFRVLVHRLVPPNDGGLALGQVAIAAARNA